MSDWFDLAKEIMEPISYNIASDIVGNRSISTAAVPCSAPVVPQMLQYETIIWEWDGRQRALMLHQIFHVCEREAKKVHGYIVNNLRKQKAITETATKTCRFCGCELTENEVKCWKDACWECAEEYGD